MNLDALSAKRTATVGTLGLLLAALALAGCKGVATQSEKKARAQVASVGSSYRPQDRQPVLPLLTTNSPLQDYLQFAVLNQPAVESAYYDWAGSIERITTARSLPDPVLTFQMDIQNVITSIMPGLMMNFPGPGKLHAGAEIASAESQARYFLFQTAVLQSAFEVKRTFYQLYFLNEQLTVNRRNEAILTSLEQLARAQNAVGKVTLQDVLRAQLEEQRLTNEIATLEDSRASMQAQFRAALGLKPQAPQPPLPRRFDSTPLTLTADQVLNAALTNNTRLKSLEAEVRGAEASIHLAEKARMPDTSLGLMADAKMSPVLYRPLATMSLPIWRDKIAAQIAEAQAAKRSAAARLTTEQINLAVSVAEKTFIYRTASRNQSLLDEQLLPKARQSLEIARTGYLSGQIDFFNLSDTERTLLGLELERVQASLQREQALAELALIVQGMPPVGSSGSPAMGMQSAPARKAGGQSKGGM